jgi:hypothetical protein
VRQEDARVHQDGYVDPANLLFARERVTEVREVARQRAETLSTLDAQCAEIFRQHPFHECPDMVRALKALLASADSSRQPPPARRVSGRPACEPRRTSAPQLGHRR